MIDDGEMGHMLGIFSEAIGGDNVFVDHLKWSEKGECER